MFEFAKNHRSNTEKVLSKGFWSWVVFLNNMGSYKRCYDEKLFMDDYKSKNVRDYKDEYLYKNIVQNDYLFGFDICYLKHLEKLNKYKAKVMNHLNSVDNPYYHIFNPIWFNKNEAYLKGYYPYKEDNSGVNSVTMFVSKEYAKQKIYNKWQ